MLDHEKGTVVLSILPRSRLRGFSLVELMVAIVIMALLVAAAIPSFNAWILNSQIRTAAESIQNGLQRARAEAVARNQNVEFGFSASAVNDQTSWTVRLPASTIIDSRASNEGSKTVTRVPTPGGATTVTFNNYGGVVNNLDGSARLTAVALDSTVLPANVSQDLMVVILPAGNIKMCDPNLPSNSTNTRACP